MDPVPAKALQDVRVADAVLLEECLDVVGSWRVGALVS
jgi:hypothetical protein